jgi:hypothetical protein
VPSEVDERNAAAGQFVAVFGGAMAAANYPVTMVRAVMEQTSGRTGTDVGTEPAGLS